MTFMTDNDKDGKIKKTIEAAKDLSEAVPIYQDGLQPATKEIGKSLETIAKTVNVALFPIKSLVWSYDKIQDFINTRIVSKLSKTPAHDIITPKGNIIVPALHAISYTGDEPDLQELFANLVASAMDKKTSSFSHPSFIDIIKNLTPDEAKLLKYFSNNNTLPLISVRKEIRGQGHAGYTVLRNFSLLGVKANCVHPELCTVALDNLQRQGLIQIPHNYNYTDKTIYEELQNDQRIVDMVDEINNDIEHNARIIESVVEVTDYGWQFINICVIDHDTEKTAPNIA